MRTRVGVPLLLALGLLAALIAAALLSNPAVSFRSVRRDGDRMAEVLIGECAVIALCTEAAGYTPLERAEIVASRLRAAMADGIAVEDVQVGPIVSGYGVFIRNQLIVAVYQDEAEARRTTAEALAELWRDNVLLALGLELPAPPPDEEAAAAEESASEGDLAPVEPAAPGVPRQ